jgi:hypothetical protein
MTKTMLSLAVTGMFALVGCGGGSGGSAGAGSCSVGTTEGDGGTGPASCIEYGGSYTASEVKTACASGTYSASACASDFVAGCKSTATGGFTYTTFYYGSGFTTSTVMSLCTTAGGTYVAAQ